MSYEKKPDSGALFKNDRKEKETHPDYKGDCLVGGKMFWISAWLNESKSGTKYMSLSFKEKEALTTDDANRAERQPIDTTPTRAGLAKTQQQQARESAGGGEFNDDIPF